MISIKSAREIELMRKTCTLAAETLRFSSTLVKPGISTDEINQIVHDYIISHDAYPSPLNYHGFPKSICTSLNSVICHGIPSPKDVLKEGDILNIDVTTYLNKFHGDTNATFLVGEVPQKVKDFVQVAEDAMMVGIREISPGRRLGSVGHAIEIFVHDHNYTVVQEYCGHGIGREFHEEPQVLHYGERNSGPILRPGMIFTVEPMINMGRRHCKLLDDKWTVITADGSLSAQFEHTILVTETGYEILTL